MCACTEPVRTGIGAVCVEYGRPKWPVTMLNHTNKKTNIPGTRYRAMFFFFFFWHPSPCYQVLIVRPGMKRVLSLKANGCLGRFAPSASSHYYLWLGRLSSCLLKPISRVQFSPITRTRRDFSLHKKIISGKCESVNKQHSMKIDEQWEC